MRNMKSTWLKHSFVSGPIQQWEQKNMDASDLSHSEYEQNFLSFFKEGLELSFIL